MTTKKKQYEALHRYTAATRALELSGAAIRILERLDTQEAKSAVDTLLRGQQRQLKLLDKAAADLGAPYGA